jgi:hypothetical protein
VADKQHSLRIGSNSTKELRSLLLWAQHNAAFVLLSRKIPSHSREKYRKARDCTRAVDPIQELGIPPRTLIRVGSGGQRDAKTLLLRVALLAERAKPGCF